MLNRFFITIIGWLANLFIWKSGYEDLGNITPSGSVFDVGVKDIWGKPFDLHYLMDKKMTLIVNVASEWGLTKAQYTEITKAHEKWKSEGF